MYGRGQLCKLNDSSINNEIHERQRRQDAPVRRRRLLVPPTRVWRDGSGAGAAPRQNLEGLCWWHLFRGSLQWKAFPDRFSWDALHLPELSQEAGSGEQAWMSTAPGPTLPERGRCRGAHNPNPLFPSLPSVKERCSPTSLAFPTQLWSCFSVPGCRVPERAVS